MIRGAHVLLGMAATAALMSAAAAAQPSLSLQDSFRIGTGGDGLCTAQSIAIDPALVDMFDRGYAITCRDAAAPVGRIYALRIRGEDPAARLAALRAGSAECRPGASETLEEMGDVATLDCRLSAMDVAYRIYLKADGGTLYAAEGLAGYDSALRLALRSVAADRRVEGEVSVATTGAGDAASFARVQAGTTSRERALAEAYRRNNSGAFAESAEFFATLSSNAEGAGRAEALANEGIQKSNLGEFAEAEALFASAARLVGEDPVVTRQLRNYRAMHLLNQGETEAAMAELMRPIPADARASTAAVQALVIDEATADQLSAETAGARRLGASEGLSPRDRAQILDAQALQLRGSILKVRGQHGEAAAALQQADRQLVAVRGGRVAASIWLRAQILGELAAIAEAGGDGAEARRLHDQAIRLLEVNYPGSSALLSAQGRLALFFARSGQRDAALAEFANIVESSAGSGTASPALRQILAGYFTLLTAADAPADASAAMFRASQLLVRPGVAQTQAVLARELSGGSDEAARLFRQAVNLARDVERLTVLLSRLEAQEPAADPIRIETVRAELERGRQAQVATQARLAEFPRYRVVTGGVLEAADLQALLRPGEAYYKMVVIDEDAYGLFLTAAGARAFRLDLTASELDAHVDALRETISTTNDLGQQITNPFDVERAHLLYRALFQPVAAEIGEVAHLIFEPDGAMLRLPPNLLVMDADSVAAYRAMASGPNADDFDFRGVRWLGRGRDVSTAVSARAFRDVRQAPPSRASAQYIGFGQNAPLTVAAPSFASRGAATAQDRCDWPLDAWNHPISASELVTARQVLGRETAGGAEVVTGAAFNDAAIETRTDLDEYRIVHFATHGLLVPPRPDCPARPALMTSFGGAESDGLLSFREIFDLRLDADIIILSACDTAGQASMVATREAGLTSGGDLAFDGLVRAFVGAGGRLVVASHWPVPDTFNATERLITGMFEAPPGTGTAAALRAAQHALMDAAETSHPFYWAAFAVVGDGATPMIRPIRTASR